MFFFFPEEKNLKMWKNIIFEDVFSYLVSKLEGNFKYLSSGSGSGSSNACEYGSLPDPDQQPPVMTYLIQGNGEVIFKCRRHTRLLHIILYKKKIPLKKNLM